MFRIKENRGGYLNDAWRKFDDHCFTREPEYRNTWKQELAMFNGRAVYDDSTGERYFEFDTEADYTFFLLRWS